MKLLKFIAPLLTAAILVSCESKEKLAPAIEPLTHEHNTPGNELHLTEQQIKLGNITTQYFMKDSSTTQQSFTGLLQVNDEQSRTISARAMGRLEKLNVKVVGDLIRQGSPVYTIYSEDIAIAKRDYMSAYRQLSMPGDFGKNARTMFDAAQQKLLFYGLSSKQVQALGKSNETSPYTVFYSPVSGFVSEVNAAEGSYVMEGGPIVKIADLGSLWLEIQVNVTYANNLSVGQSAKATVSDFPGKTINAKITYINPEINPQSRLLVMRLEVPNSDLRLKPGMQAVATFTKAGKKGLYIPIDAVIREEKSTYIWIEKEPGVFQNVMVEIGTEANGMIEIKSEVDLSKKIVVSGAYAINSEYILQNGIDPMEGMDM